MRVLIGVALAAVLLSGGAARADTLFPVTNAHECIAAAKRSALPDDARRYALAECMYATPDPFQSAMALDLAGFAVNPFRLREVMSANMAGRVAEARALLAKLIIDGR